MQNIDKIIFNCYTNTVRICRLICEGVIMNKNKVHVKIGGASYTIVTEDDTEYVEDLAEMINNEIKSICNSNPSLSITQAAVLVALDQADANKKATASSDNLRAQIKDYLEDSARARMEVDVARREVEGSTAKFPSLGKSLRINNYERQIK